MFFLILQINFAVSFFFFYYVQFNYMHECFERVFCELRWRKEVNDPVFARSPALLGQNLVLLTDLFCSVFCSGGRGGDGQRQQELQ